MAAHPAPLHQAGDDGRDGASSLLDHVIDALSEGLAVFDAEARLLRCNRVFRRINQVVLDLLVPGLSWHVLLREWAARDHFPIAVCNRIGVMESQLADGTGHPEPLQVETGDGQLLALSMRQTAAEGFVLIQTDITSRRRGEENDREADALLRKVLQACPANIMMSRVADGQIIYRTHSATELLGHARHAQQHFASREELADFITALLPDGRVDDMPVTGLRPDGSRFPCLVSARMIDYRGEDVMVSSTVDISKEMALRQTLATQREQIFQAEKLSALGELLASVAHELNNPLSVVVGQAMMVRDYVTDVDTLRRVKKISDSAERCARIVKSFLALAREQPTQLVPIDLAATVATAIESLRAGSQAVATTIDFHAEPGLPPVRGDASQIAQILANLVCNADQAIRWSGIGDRIRVELRHLAEAAVVELRVADNGPGIDPAIERRIFDPLFTTKPAGAGTGLGLALSRRLVLAHGGSIRLESPAAPGAVLVVQLPAATDVSVDAAEPGNDLHPARGRVLVVDDEADVAELIEEILVRDGFDVILTDLNMPGIGGRGFHERVLRAHPDLAPRIAFVTGDTMSPQARGLLDGLGNAFLEKPIAPAELRRLVHTVLGAGNGTRP